jgi:phenylacetate-CoA ligase
MADAFPNRAAIEAGQLAALRSLLGALRQSNPFYTPRLDAAGLDAHVLSLAEFMRRCPFTTKPELVADQAAHRPHGSNLTCAPGRYTRLHQTSGTRGAPLRWLDTPESWQWMLENWAEVYHAAGVTAADRIFFAFSFGPFLGFWTAFEAAAQLGSLCIPGGGLSSAARLRMILENRATVLCCTPTYAIHLAEVAARESIDLATGSVRRIIVAGEPGGSLPATRARIQSLWLGASLCDHHGMTETGPVTRECPARAGVLHVIERAYLAEVVDPATGAAALPGEGGELVLTTLGRIGSPVLRYRTGDWVKPAAQHSPCACGTHELALEGGLLGRVDDMLIIRGVNIYPAAVEEIIHHCGGVAEYRARVTTHAALAELTLTIEPPAGCADALALARTIERALHAAFQLRIPVQLAAPGSLPRFEMKARRWERA